MGTAIVLLVLAVIVSLVVKSMIRDRKSGKSISCGGDCSHCHKCS
ncbi:MAG: FeoB-associated Cys-rich membrane protein [Blautia sp.]|nr:FeoB-associated Cys-rich membrane protein [Blautia sp.]